MLRKTDPALSRDSAARRGCLFNFRVAIAGAYSRFPGPSTANDDIPRLQILVQHLAHHADELIRTLLGYAQRSRRVSHRGRLAVINSNRMRHKVSINRAGRAGCPEVLARTRHFFYVVSRKLFMDKDLDGSGLI